MTRLPPRLRRRLFQIGGSVLLTAIVPAAIIVAIGATITAVADVVALVILAAVGGSMTDYERGFNDGFAEAISRANQARGAPGSVEADFDGGKKISIAFRPEQFAFICDLQSALACSFAAAVRHLIDQNMRARQ